MSPSAIDFEATNGYSSHQNGPSSPTNSDAPYDLVCVGFGPAALAIAVALHDSGLKRNVLFLEKQSHFAWHSGMLIPSAKMQISFVKDLATFRSPQSHFTFLNYLHTKNRLAQFCNLNTFLPHREEFNDYLTWAAGHFDECVRYSSDTQSISPVSNSRGDVQYWEVTARDTRSEELSHFTAKDVVIAVGGSPKLPRSLDSFGERIVHSSQYLKAVPRILSNQERKTRVAVVGGGQSAAEIFEDLMNKYPNVHATLYTSGAALKPSDDSPFVNEIFDACRVDEFYHMSPSARLATVADNRATNYSVVRPELLDRLYEAMYHQRLYEPDSSKWQHQIIGNRELAGAEETRDGKLTLTLLDKINAAEVKDGKDGHNGHVEGAKGSTYQVDDVDLVITGTGYVRNAHETLLKPLSGLFVGGPSDVDRDYRLRLNGRADGCGIWLQGCCEQSHGLSDSLLSILAVRGGEIVDAIFGERRADGTCGQGSNGVKRNV